MTPQAPAAGGSAGVLYTCRLWSGIRPIYVKTLNPAYFSITYEAVKKVIVSMSDVFLVAMCAGVSLLAVLTATDTVSES